MIINTGKTFKGGWEVSTVFWQCFACINITEQTVLVQSVYVKRHSLLSLHLAHTLACLFVILPFLSNGTKLLIISPFQTSLMGQATIWTERKLCKYETCFFLAVLYQDLLNMQQCQKRIKKFPYHGFYGSTYDMKLTFVSHYARSYHMYSAISI